MSDMVSIDNEIAELRAVVVRVEKLEAENRALKAEVARLKNPRRPITPITERQVTVTEALPVSTFPMPTSEELTKLFAAVGHHYPVLLSIDGPAFSGSDAERRKQYREQFEASFLAIGNMRRLEKPSTTFLSELSHSNRRKAAP